MHAGLCSLKDRELIMIWQPPVAHYDAIVMFRFLVGSHAECMDTFQIALVGLELSGAVP